MRVTKESVYAMSDEELAKALAHLAKAENTIDSIKLTDWEATFLQTAPMFWANAGGYTWKQRKTARLLILKICGILERRQSLP